jgi:Uma2 family endonuclease
MTQAKHRFSSFEDYLSYRETEQDNVRYELVEGELIELAPESPQNNFVARRLLFFLASHDIIPLELLVNHACEVQVPVLQPKDAANRFPDLVVLRPEHLDLMGNRLTITTLMPPPQLIVEVVSPGKTNRALFEIPARGRDYINKRAQYAAIAVPEYWLIDPIAGTVLVLQLQGDGYETIGLFSGGEAIGSSLIQDGVLTVDRVLGKGA